MASEFLGEVTMDDTFEIRPGTREDIPQIAGVVCASWQWAYADFMDSALLAAWTDLPRRQLGLTVRWRDETPKSVAVLADGRVVGFTIDQVPPNLPGFDAEIGGFYVHPTSAGQGIGKALFDHAVARYRIDGRANLAIHTLADNRIGRGFYEKMGGKLHCESIWQDLKSVWYAWSLSPCEQRAPQN